MNLQQKWNDRMVIYGVSQSSGVERQLKFDRAGAAVLLTIFDHKGVVERERILVNSQNVVDAVMSPSEGGTAITGEAPTSGSPKVLDLEVRRNELWLRCHAPNEEGCDVAVGLDDFQDALEKMIASE